MQVDDAFCSAVIERAGLPYYPYAVIVATLAVAAERGMVVPAGAPKMWAVKDSRGDFVDYWEDREDADAWRMAYETVVRVAVVEIKE